MKGAFQVVDTDGAIIYCYGLLDGTGKPALRDAAIRVESGRVRPSAWPGLSRPTRANA